MSLYIRLKVSFWSHRKTLRLRATLGDCAFWLPLKLWCYAAENQPGRRLLRLFRARISNARRDSKAMLKQCLKHCNEQDSWMG